jgi:hypothetical protein
MIIGDRVQSNFFGEGSIIKMLKSDLEGCVMYYIVKWDNNPPMEYNMGNNPCMVSPYELKKI